MIVLTPSWRTIAIHEGTRCTTIQAGYLDELVDDVLTRAESIGPKASVAYSIGDYNEFFLPHLEERMVSVEGDSAEKAALSSIIDAFKSFQTPIKPEMPQTEAEQRRCKEVDEILSLYWGGYDGTIDDAEKIFVNSHVPSSFALDQPSTYGEVTAGGARHLFEAMDLRLHDENVVFADLGSGAGKLVTQAWLELPHVRQSIGIELSPTRHKAALRSWSTAVRSGAIAQLERDQRSSEPQFELGSFLEADLSEVTHAYVASLCMGDDLVEALWNHLRRGAPRLRIISTLRAFRGEEAAAMLWRVARIQCTWDSAGEPGTEVFIYKMRTRSDEC